MSTFLYYVYGKLEAILYKIENVKRILEARFSKNVTFFFTYFRLYVHDSTYCYTTVEIEKRKVTGEADSKKA